MPFHFTSHVISLVSEELPLFYERCCLIYCKILLLHIHLSPLKAVVACCLFRGGAFTKLHNRVWINTFRETFLNIWNSKFHTKIRHGYGRANTLHIFEFLSPDIVWSCWWNETKPFLSLSFKEHIWGLSLKCRATLLACTQFEKGHGDLKFELRF